MAPPSLDTATIAHDQGDLCAKPNVLIPGLEAERRDPALSQWYTPSYLADQIFEWAWAPNVRRVLEPSAGVGNLVAPWAKRACDVHAFEIDETKADALRARFPSVNVVSGVDFLDVFPMGEGFDLVVMNPPYENGQDVAHIERALKWAPRVVALVLHSMVFSQGRRDFWRRVQIRRGVRLSKRPKFGPRGGERDFVVLELCKRNSDTAGSESTETWEWWT
jgi:predicted RNA methylase